MLASATALAPAAHTLAPLTGASVAHIVDYTDMPGEALRVIAADRVGPAAGWSTLDAARAGALELSAAEGPDNPAVGIFQRGGHFEAYHLDYGFDSVPGMRKPLEAYWGEGDIGLVRTEAGVSLRAIADNGAINGTTPYAQLRRELTRF